MGGGSLRLLDQADDFREYGVAPHSIHADAEGAIPVERSPHDGGARGLRDRDGFAGEHRLVHAAGAVEHRAVGGDRLAWPDEDFVTHAELAERILSPPQRERRGL